MRLATLREDSAEVATVAAVSEQVGRGPEFKPHTHLGPTRVREGVLGASGTSMVSPAPRT